MKLLINQEKYVNHNYKDIIFTGNHVDCYSTKFKCLDINFFFQTL